MTWNLSGPYSSHALSSSSHPSLIRFIIWVYSNSSHHSALCFCVVSAFSCTFTQKINPIPGSINRTLSLWGKAYDTLLKERLTSGTLWNDWNKNKFIRHTYTGNLVWQSIYHCFFSFQAWSTFCLKDGEFSLICTSDSPAAPVPSFLQTWHSYSTSH